jgi:hypothetical protein
MSDNVQKQINGMRDSPEVFERVQEIQASMVESAESRFDESELGHLRCLIRLAVEFHDYLEHGSVKVARSMLQGPHAKYVPDAQSASADPFNKYDLGFMCESVRSGVDSFCTLSTSYRMLDGATGSKVEWSMISSKELFRANFAAMFRKFTEEMNFESKCRLLLDLFKLQIVFAGICYND